MPTETVVIEKQEPTTGGRGPGQYFGDDGGRGGRGGPQEMALRIYLTGMWLGLGAITMVFAAFTSAYIVRRGLSNDWSPTQIPGLLWFNTAILVLSSLTLERARRAVGRALAKPAQGAGRRPASALRWFWLPVLSVQFRRWWTITTALGVIFLCAQIAAWRLLAAQGVYLASNPSSSFFYLLTGAHGLHLLGGVVALLYVLARAREAAPEPLSRTPVEVTALYWHFMDGLWIYIFLVLLYWR